MVEETRATGNTAVAVEGGSLPNAPGAASPTPPTAPEYEEFANLVSNLRALQRRGLIDLGQTASDEQAIVLEVLPAARGLAEVAAITDALGAPPGTMRFTLTTSSATEPGAIPVVTRSVVGSMFFLSQGVEAPVRDQLEGRVTVTLDEDGRPFDWSDVTGGLMSIRSSERAPDNAYTGVAYRGSWFYIDDSDLESKSTFALLTQLSALQAGSDELGGPVLTLPVR